MYFCQSFLTFLSPYRGVCTALTPWLTLCLSARSMNQRAKTIETVSVKQLAQHELSVELQLYYKEITEACVGSDESRRAVRDERGG